MQAGRCIRWSGPAVGDGMSIDGGIRVWTFTLVDSGVLVRTEENWNGTQVETDVPTSTRCLGAGLEAWLANLRTAAERLEHGCAAPVGQIFRIGVDGVS
ncbi:hypothetical protein [Nocardia sp. NPDC051981]|uniref:hypothetical protein n=1 Tax=Nocardia sp. NPDC051981 TaxID=3155417 RepID=UPI00341C0507